MSGQSGNTKLDPALVEKIKDLEKSTNIASTIQILENIETILAPVDISKLPNPNVFLIQFVKPVARQAANINTAVFPQSKKLLQKLFYQITALYAKAARYCYLLDGFELLKEFLSRSTQIFKNKSGAGAFSTEQEQRNNEEELKSLEWIRDYVKIEKTDKTAFFYKCCNQAVTILSGTEQIFGLTNVNYTKQYFLFVDYIQWYVKRQKVEDMVVKGIKVLEQIFVNPQQYKQFSKDITFHNGQRLAFAINKVAKQSYTVGIKKRVEIMSSNYALTLLPNQSIQKKITGLKILNKWAKHFTANPSTYVKQEQYCRWLLDNKIIEIIMQNGNNFTIVKTCNDIIRLFLRKKCLGEDNFNKLFDFIHNNSTSEVRQLIFKLMDMEAIKLQYNDYEYVFDQFTQIQKGDFYEEEMFNFLIQILRYSTYTQSKKAVNFMGQILKKNWQKFRNDRIKNKCMTCFVKATSKIIQKNSDLDERFKDILAMYDSYFSEPSFLGIKIIKNIIDGLPDVAYISKNKAALRILKERSILLDGIQLIAKKVQFWEQLQQLICFMLNLAHDSYNQKLIFQHQSFFNATKSPKIFNKMLYYVNYTQDLDLLFQQLVSKFEIDGFSFICIKFFFYRLNTLYTKKIDEPYAEDQYQLSTKVCHLKGYDHLNYLLKNAANQQLRNQIADFISDLYTTYREQSAKEGEEQLLFAMKKTIKLTLQAYQNLENPRQILSNLAMIEYLMMATETLGVGALRAHNSLVTTSTVTIKVFNQITDFNDVLKVFQKKMPSNLTVFQLIQEISKLFKCSPCQIMFREGGKTLPDKWNGLTLEEAQFDGKTLSAIKSFRERVRRQQLLVNDELTPKARAAFEDIYNTFAVDGKMGKRQCANYVEGVTRTSCLLNDYRVQQFFKQWDSDHDDNITLEDFVKFYKSNSVPLKDEVVWKNLSIMKFRKNLKKYDEPIEPPVNQLLFRYYLSQSMDIYQILFALSENGDEQLKRRSIRLLLRLPTCPSLLKSLSEKLDLIKMSSFQTEYLLITIIYRLSSHENKLEGIKEFIQSGNVKLIFEMVLRIDEMQNQTKQELKCLYISLQILRSLNTVPDLRANVEEGIILNDLLELPETNLFLKLIKSSLHSMDFSTLQSALALQISQASSQVDSIIEAVFHQQMQIRKMVCNYVFICCKIGKINIDPFDVEAKQNCQYWFGTLSMMIRVKQSQDFDKILLKSLERLATRSESVQKNPEDPIIFGNLSVIHNIIEFRKVKLPHNFVEQILDLAKRLISVRNRNMIYNLLATQDIKFAVQYVTDLLDSVTPRKQISKKRFSVGIKNLGSTCYMNSILQMLFKIDEFRSLIFELENKNELTKTEIDGLEFYDDMLYQLQKMYSYIQLSTREHYHPKQFCLTIKNPVTNKPINPNIQEDVHEFLARFLQSLEGFMKDSPKLNVFKKIFQGKTLTEFTCLQCHNKITREQNFCQLPLQVKNIQNLAKSFQKFIQPESISDYFCEPCQKKVDKIERSTYLSQVPQIMIINLRRIIFDLQTFQNVKVDSNFKFPMELDISDYVSKQATNVTPDDYNYFLKGIVVHSGTSQSGHYYSIIKDGDQWFKFNDQTVSKFDLKDLPREAFGGTQTYDQWSDQLKFSTNAYILFYEKHHKASQNNAMKINPQLTQEIENDNKLFFHELQVHQQSVFEFSTTLYERYRPLDITEKIKNTPFEQFWENDPNVPVYELVYDLMHRLLRFLKTFYQIKIDMIYKIGAYLYELYYLIPEKSYSLLHQLDAEYCIEVLCLHNDDHVRSVYSTLIPKALHVYSNFYGLNLNDPKQIDGQNTAIRKLLQNLYNYMQDERLTKNIYKSYKYFDLWKICAEYIPQVSDFLQSKQTIVTLVDLLMANDSPIIKEKKRPDIPQYQSIPIIQLLFILMKSKMNLVNYISPKAVVGVTYKHLTENQKKMIGNVNFYRKMIKNKSDNDLLATISGKLCENDEQFSKKMVQMFLKSLNSSYDQIQSSLLMINHLKQYLLIDDEHAEKRMKWVLGIPQLQIGDDMNYGVRYSDESTTYSYVSSLYFVQNDQYQPALNVLFLKRSIYSQFSIAGVSLLLEVMTKSDKAFRYLMGLPAPNYIYRSYPDWIWQFITKLKEQDSYYLQIDKNMAYNSLIQLYQGFQEKLKNYKQNLPVNKYIIGTNKQCKMVASLSTKQYQMALWAHNTYVLQNVPTGTMNKSLPKNLFKFAQPVDYAQYFVCLMRKKQLPQNQQLVSMLTVYTLYIDTKQNLKIQFKFKQFHEQVSFLRGKTQINFPYQQFPDNLEDMLSIQIIQGEDRQTTQLINTSTNMEIQFPVISQTQPMQNNTTVMEEKQCMQCTYINFGRENCEICDYKLY